MPRRDIASILFAIATFPVDYLVYRYLPSISTILIIIATVSLLTVATLLWISDKKDGKERNETEKNIDEQRIAFQRTITNEFCNIVHSLEPPTMIVIPFHIQHIDYTLWNLKSESEKIKLLGADDFMLLDNFYKAIDRWNDEASRRFQEIHNETVRLAKQIDDVYSHVKWISSGKPELEQVIMRLKKRFNSETKTGGWQEATGSA